MPTFLTTKGVTSCIEDIIKYAKEFIVLVSPFLDVSKNFTERLNSAKARGVHITLIYGKTRQLHEDYDFADSFYYKDLHGKCYYNESQMLITSMNLYEASENNREFGISISKDVDKELYEKAELECNDIKKQAFPNGKRKRTQDFPLAVSKMKCNDNNINFRYRMGYCISCKNELPFNISKPFCNFCYKKFCAYRNLVNSIENFCHSCSRDYGTSYYKPLCIKCYRDYNHSMNSEESSSTPKLEANITPQVINNHVCPENNFKTMSSSAPSLINSYSLNSNGSISINITDNSKADKTISANDETYNLEEIFSSQITEDELEPIDIITQISSQPNFILDKSVSAPEICKTAQEANGNNNTEPSKELPLTPSIPQLDPSKSLVNLRIIHKGGNFNLTVNDCLTISHLKTIIRSKSIPCNSLNFHGSELSDSLTIKEAKLDKGSVYVF